MPYLLEWIEYRLGPLQSRLIAYQGITNRCFRLIPVAAAARRSQDLGEAALIGFRHLGPAARAAIPELASIAKSSTNWFSADAAVTALGAIGPEAIPTLLPIATSHRSFSTARCEAIDCLAKLGASATSTVPALVECTREQNIYIVRAAVFALASLKANPELAVPALIDCLRNADLFDSSSDWGPGRGLRPVAAFALGEFGPQAHAAVPALIEALGKVEGDDSTGCQILRTMGAIATDLDFVLPVLTNYLQGTNLLLRHCSAVALAGLGPRAHDALPALTRALQYEDSRKMVSKAIRMIGPDFTTNSVPR